MENKRTHTVKEAENAKYRIFDVDDMMRLFIEIDDSSEDVMDHFVHLYAHYCHVWFYIMSHPIYHQKTVDGELVLDEELGKWDEDELVKYTVDTFLYGDPDIKITPMYEDALKSLIALEDMAIELDEERGARLAEEEEDVV